jgi:DNA-binding protein YbaB
VIFLKQALSKVHAEMERLSADRASAVDQYSKAGGGEVKVIPQGHGGLVIIRIVKGKGEHATDKGTRWKQH